MIWILTFYTFKLLHFLLTVGMMIWFKIIFTFKGKYVCKYMCFVKAIQDNPLKCAVLFCSVRNRGFQIVNTYWVYLKKMMLGTEAGLA